MRSCSAILAISSQALRLSECNYRSVSIRCHSGVSRGRAENGSVGEEKYIVRSVITERAAPPATLRASADVVTLVGDSIRKLSNAEMRIFEINLVNVDILPSFW